VILIWLSGGPSQLDTWDPKPDAPSEIRGPFSSIPTSVPGVRITEHFPLQAQIASKLSFLRAVDCSMSNHTPITLQAGNPLARRTDIGRDGDGYPSMGSVADKFRGANDPDLPAIVGLAPSWVADVWEAGHMGGAFAPVNGDHLAGRCSLPEGLQLSRLADRDALRAQFDGFRKELDRGENLDKLARSQRQAFEMVSTGKVQKAFNLAEEPDALRDAYGRDSIGTQALVSRRLVEAGVTFITTSARWGYFDTHGDNVPPYLGIEKGLKLLLPGVDRTIHTLVTDLEERGLLDTTLILVLGEFGDDSLGWGRRGAIVDQFGAARVGDGLFEGGYSTGRGPELEQQEVIGVAEQEGLELMQLQVGNESPVREVRREFALQVLDTGEG